MKKFVKIIFFIIIILAVYFLVWNWIDTRAKMELSKIQEKQDEERKFLLENNKIKEADDSELFYLEEGKMFVLDYNKEPLQVPGDFSEMTKEDYKGQNHQANINYGDIYFYYELGEKIYLVKSINVNSNEWMEKELTDDELIGMPEGSKIKALRISGNMGYLFYVGPDGNGKVLKTITKGETWYPLNIDAELDDTCKMVFLNGYGLTTDTFLRVPSKDGEKCDLYQLNILGPTEIEKMDITANYDKELDYYMTPSYLNNSGATITIEVGKDSKDTNPVKFVTPNWGLEWITEEENEKRQKEAEQAFQESIINYNKSADNLDETIFLTDFSNYKPDSNEIVISKEKAKDIADVGFAESASRIAAEGIKDTVAEGFEIQEVYPNNYFTRKYEEGDQIYNTAKRKVYVFSKYNDMGHGVSIYVDVTTGLIIGARAFSD